jgi:ubiquinone biosynthesis protein UbiJ
MTTEMLQELVERIADLEQQLGEETKDKGARIELDYVINDIQALKRKVERLDAAITDLCESVGLDPDDY